MAKKQDFPELSSQTKQGPMARKRRKRRASPIAWIGVSFVLLSLLVLVTLPIWIPLVRYIIPDRYIASYAPEWVSDIAFAADADAVIPATSLDTEGAELLLQVTPTLSALPTATPAPDVAQAEELPSRADEALAARPTPTPAYIGTGNETINNGGEGGIADYSQADLNLVGFTHTYQGWNNCGPASIITLLSYWNFEQTQTDAVNFLKTDPEDRNVRPDEIAAYVQSIGFGATVRVNGDIELLKSLLDAGFPVMIEKGFDPEPDELGWMGHYLVLTGYSDTAQEFYAMDSYLGPDRSISYHQTDKFWRHFNRLYIVPHAPEQAGAVANIIGADTDDTTMWTNSLVRAQSELNFDQSDAFGWYNLGASLYNLGRYEEAETAFDQARELGIPWRMLWYQYEPYQTYLEVGGDRLQDVIFLADDVIANNIYSEEAYYFKGLAYLQQGESTRARNMFNNALKYNANYQAARDALNSIEQVGG